MSAEQALLVMYQRAAVKLRRDIARALGTSAIATAGYRQQQLVGVLSMLEQLNRRTRPLATAAAAGPYNAGARAVDIAAPSQLPDFTFTGSHLTEARILAANLTTRLGDATALVGRRTDDAFRRVGLERVSQGLLAGEARRDTSAAIVRQLIDEGVTDAVTGFVDRRGARWQLDTYAEMVARTTTREAMSAGTRGRMTETDQDLVTISAHGTEDDLCAEHEGVTYSITGRTAGYPVMTDDDWPPYHPRCLHVATPAAENLDHVLRALGVQAETGSP